MNESNNDKLLLRRQAEEFLKVGPPSSNKLPESRDALVRLVHELQVHQIELEIQNEELKQARSENEQLLEQYTDLYDFAPVGYLSLAVDGSIQQSNLAAARLLGKERLNLQQTRLSNFINLSDRKVFADFLQQLFTSSTPAICTVQLLSNGEQKRTVQIEAVHSADTNECRAILTDISERRTYELELKNYQDNLNEMVAEKTRELKRILNLMVGREVRMSGLKDAVKKLRKQLNDLGVEPVADDPIYKD